MANIPGILMFPQQTGGMPLQPPTGGAPMAQPYPVNQTPPPAPAGNPAAAPMQRAQAGRFSLQNPQFQQFLMGLGSAMSSGRGGFGQALMGMQQQAMAQKRAAGTNNFTAQWLRTEAERRKEPRYMQIADAIDSGQITGEQGLGFAKSLTVEQPENPAAVREYEYARQQGYSGSFADWRKSNAAQTTVNVGDQFPKPPSGYSYVYDEAGKPRMDERGVPMLAPMLGGPEDKSSVDATKAAKASTATSIVTRSAALARSAARNRNFGAFGQNPVSMLPWTDSAETARQVEVLKSIAKIENLQQMRNSSPTGGALGSVSDKENEMLALASGALDPASPTFERDLDFYELTLLEIIHGPEVGKRIFNETRQNPSPQTGQQPMQGGVEGQVKDWREFFQ